MLKGFLGAVVTCLLFALPATAELLVADAVITTAIEKQMPVDNIKSYPADYGKLFCFTRVTGAEAATSVTHVWYYQDNEMARVTLPIGSADWRTYSSKRFLPQWSGQWKVVVVDEEGQQLIEVPFVLE
ncbi:Protein of unknown function [Malonomonas rubra DSM 5091]|uniref:DUF2914 domain-containing protein n=1 Tax=Malonomonas rubra DSM 5091 TaxID=1122189 RepID=A0A1M6BY13_MALRU|nr:DUF2914 domain-containing protein [Malonomonas rubra]SHI53511.1 Protein of unknown function [Malonomonas rubra DSM 5091]